MSILFGIYKQDSGTIKKLMVILLIFHLLKTRASKSGIIWCTNIFKLIDTFSVLDNVILGTEGTVALGMIARKKDCKRTSANY